MSKCFRVLAGFMSVLMAFAGTVETFALSESQLDFFSENNILFYDPEGGDECVTTGSTAGGSCANLAEVRKAKWDSDTGDKSRFFRRVGCEADISNGKAMTKAVMETIFNRNVVRGSVITTEVGDGTSRHGYYGTCHNGGAGADGANKAAYEELLEEVLNGSNLTNFATGNGSDGLNSSGKPVDWGRIVCVIKSGAETCDSGIAYDNLEKNTGCTTAPGYTGGECFLIEDNSADETWAAEAKAQCGGGTLSSVSTTGGLNAPAPTSLTGATPQEKVWNYFKQRGLTDVAAAGAMGNIEQEDSSFDPWMGEGGSVNINKEVLKKGFGLIQWTNTQGDTHGRRYRVMKHLEDNGIKLDATDESQFDKALLLELNWLWDGEYNGMTWQEQLNAESTVDGDPSISYKADNTGNGTAMLFHKLVERSGDSTAGKQERIDSAKKFLLEFGGMSGGCGVGPLSSDISELALQLAWPEKIPNDLPESYVPTDAYVEAMKKAGTGDTGNGCVHEYKGGSAGDSCDRFVSTVFRLTVDSDIPAGNVDTIYSYLHGNPNYLEIRPNGDTSKVQKGDIVITGTEEDKGHIMLVAELADGTLSIVDASCSDRTASVRHYLDAGSNSWVFRWQGGQPNAISE